MSRALANGTGPIATGPVPLVAPVGRRRRCGSRARASVTSSSAYSPRTSASLSISSRSIRARCTPWARRPGDRVGPLVILPAARSPAPRPRWSAPSALGGNHCGPPGGGRAHRAQRRVMPPTQAILRFQALLLGARSLPGNHSLVATPCAVSTGYFIAFFTIFSASAASRSTPRTSESRSR